MKRAALLMLLLAGCATQMSIPRYEVTDLATGKVYTCEGRYLHKTAHGVSFRDADTDSTVSLGNASTRRIEDAKYNGHYDAWDNIWVTDAKINP